MAVFYVDVFAPCAPAMKVYLSILHSHGWLAFLSLLILFLLFHDRIADEDGDDVDWDLLDDWLVEDDDETDWEA